MDNLFQSKAWEEFKLRTGYQASFWIDGILILKKNFPLGYSMLYSPMVDYDQVSSLDYRVFREKITELAKKERTVFYRLEFNIPQLPTTNYQLPTSFIKAFETMQPEHTLILDLTQNEALILDQMKPKGRYNIKIAEKANIKVRHGNSQIMMDHFYDLYETTGKRHGISYRSKRYFNELLAIVLGFGYGTLWEAYIEEPSTNPEQRPRETILCSAVLFFSKERAIYLFGASGDYQKQLKATSLLQWEMIKESKRLGYKEYDFFGIAPTDDDKHPWAGVTRFKKQFGGKEEAILGSHDLVFKPIEYQIFKLAEKIRR